MSAIVENAVGGLIASEAHGVIGIVLSRINAEIKLAWGFKKELEEIQGQLTRLMGLLQGSFSQAITNSLMAVWLKSIKDAAYDADDLLDEWSYEALEARFRTRKRDKFIRGVSKPFYSLRMGHKARDLTNLISNIYRDANKLGIKPIHVAAGEVYNSKHSHHIEDRETRLCNMRHYVDEKLLIGRDEDLTHLVKLLCDPNNSFLSDLTVIGIVGMAGLGKTTLCKRISKVHEVKKFFNSMVIWLVISSSFDLLDVLNRMVEIVFKESSNMRDRHALISRLREKLEEKRYLLILDDVWDTIDWEPLKSTLEEIGGSCGTIVLVTSRDKFAVGKMVTDCYDSEGKITIKKPSIYMLQGLSEGDSWALFMVRINDDNLVGNEKELIARRMMKNCGGVPLALKALGDLLRDKDIEMWKEFEKSHLWTNKDKNGILPSLRLSYDYLPCTDLKKCFAYCAIFEEDDIIEKQKLIYMWMAQGFLHPYVEMEDKGEEYIEHLLNSSLFQEPKMDEFGKVKTFKMHDLVWSLARVISMGECWFSDEDEMSNEVRHLIVPKHSESKELALTSSTKSLRTCLLYNKKLEGPSLHVLLNFNKLRVLDIGQNRSEDFDWELLGRLKHLRYFGSSASYGLGFIAKLYHLQTLCIYKHNQLGSDPDKSIFPKEIGNLVNLRHILYDNDIGVPLGLGNLTALQTLPSINLVKKWGGRLSELGSLIHLRGTLKLYNLCNLSGKEEARNVLLNKSYLKSLAFNWAHTDYLITGKKVPNDKEILEALQPNVNLKMFEIWNYCGTRLPKWLVEGGSSLPNLVSLKIYRCEAEGDLKLENLRYLRFLTVQYCKELSITLPKEGFGLEEIMVVGCSFSYFGSIFRNSTSFGSLRCLRELCTDVMNLFTFLGEDSAVCKSLEKLKLIGDNSSRNDLPDQLQHLRALQCLAIEDFSTLNIIPNWLGKLTSLRELSLLRLPSLEYLPKDEMRHLSNLITFTIDGNPISVELWKTSSCWMRHGKTWSRYPFGFRQKRALHRPDLMEIIAHRLSVGK